MQHRGNIGDDAPFQLHQSAAYIHAARGRNLPLLNQGKVAGSAADVHVEHGFAGAPAVVRCSGSLGCQDAFQIRPRRRHHKMPRQIGKRLHHRSGIFRAAAFTGDNHRAGVHHPAGDARLFILLLHQAAQRSGIHAVAFQQGRKVHRALV